MESKNRFQFELRDLLMAITFLAIGLPGLSTIWPIISEGVPHSERWVFDVPLSWNACRMIASLTVLGAGAGALFQRKCIFALVGFFIGLVTLGLALRQTLSR